MPTTIVINVIAVPKTKPTRHQPVLRQHLGNVAVLKKAHAPLFILHGTDDTLIPLSESEKLFAAASAPKTLAKLEKAGHNDSFSLT